MTSIFLHLSSAHTNTQKSSDAEGRVKESSGQPGVATWTDVAFRRGRAVRGCGEGMQLPQPLTHSQPVSPLIPLSWRALWSEGCLGQLMSSVLSIKRPWARTWRRSASGQLGDHAKPWNLCNEGTTRPVQSFPTEDCHPDCPSRKLTCQWVWDVGEALGGPAGFSCDRERVHRRYVFFDPSGNLEWEHRMPRKFPSFFFPSLFISE